jgi:hypothetical protein
MVSVTADLFGDTVIHLSIGNGANVTFTTPSFCDSLMVPVISSNKESYNGLIHDFDNLMNHLNDVRRDFTSPSLI